MLFLLAGNCLASYRTKSTREVRGLIRRLPLTGILWLAGLLSITGTPPFGTFVSELMVLKGALDQGRTLVGALYLALLTLIFVGIAPTMTRMAQGAAPPGLPASSPREPWLAVLPPLILGAAVLLLGLYLPSGIEAALRGAAGELGAR
jgi:hydrogenase-4 component F